MLCIKQDPINIAISLIFNLNLLEENKEYNINEVKSLKNLGHHWITIKKYLKICNLINKYCPKFELYGSRFRITNSKIYQRLSEKEKFILFLFNNQAFDEDSAMDFSVSLNKSGLDDSIDYLYKKTESNKFYLTKSGINKYKLIEQNLTELIYNEKKIDEVFEKSENLFPEFKKDWVNFSYLIEPESLKMEFDSSEFLKIESTTSSGLMQFSGVDDLTEEIDIIQK